MKIIHFIAENYKRLQVVEIKPDGSVVEIKGRNAQGKSSTLDAIYAALAGMSAVPSKPIRKGADESRIELKLGNGETVELVVKRTFKRRDDDTFTTSITVENGKGAHYRQPQTLLDGLLGALSFDPLAFTRMSPKEQLHALRKLVPGVDFDAIDAENLGDYDRRTEVNRDIKALRAQIAALQIPGDPRDERIDEAALVAELDKAGERKAEIEKLKAERENAQRGIDANAEYAADERADAKRYRAKILALRLEIVELEKMVEMSDVAATRAEADVEAARTRFAELPPIPDAPDTSALIDQIDNARENNRGIDERERALKQRENLAERLKAAEQKADDFTRAIARREKQKADAVAAAKLPIDDLSFGSEAVLLNDLPLDVASDAEQLRVSVAIAAAMNPRLRVIRVRDGSLLDDDGMRLLAEFAEKNDLQIWVERVSSDASVGIVIEDGKVKATEAA